MLPFLKLKTTGQWTSFWNIYVEFLSNLELNTNIKFCK
jgi:hypothetical protein